MFIAMIGVYTAVGVEKPPELVVCCQFLTVNLSRYSCCGTTSYVLHPFLKTGAIFIYKATPLLWTCVVYLWKNKQTKKCRSWLHIYLHFCHRTSSCDIAHAHTYTNTHFTHTHTHTDTLIDEQTCLVTALGCLRWQHRVLWMTIKASF